MRPRRPAPPRPGPSPGPRTISRNDARLPPASSEASLIEQKGDRLGFRPSMGAQDDDRKAWFEIRRGRCRDSDLRGRRGGASPARGAAPPSPDAEGPAGRARQGGGDEHGGISARRRLAVAPPRCASVRLCAGRPCEDAGQGRAAFDLGPGRDLLRKPHRHPCRLGQCQHDRAREDSGHPDQGQGQARHHTSAIEHMAELILTTFDWVPEAPRGFVRDIRVRWALEEAHLPYRVESVSFEKRDDASLSHQPFGQVPWLTDGGLSIFESGAILLHLGGLSEKLIRPTRAAKAKSSNGYLPRSIPWRWRACPGPC